MKSVQDQVTGRRRVCSNYPTIAQRAVSVVRRALQLQYSLVKSHVNEVGIETLTSHIANGDGNGCCVTR